MLRQLISRKRRAEPRARAPRWRTVMLAVGCLLSLPSTPVHAERADREKPINLEADRVAVDEKKQLSTFEGGVVLTQGTMRITADKIIVKQDKAGVQTASAFGKPATFRQKRDGVEEYVEAFADRAEYDGRAEKLELHTNAMLKRGLDEVRGSYISYEINSEYIQVFGNAPQSASQGAAPGRVRAVIQPKPKTPAQSAAKPDAAKPEAGSTKE